MTAKATVSTKGQIAIPKAIRERLNLKPGTQLALEVEGERLVMKRHVPEFPDWRTMQGMAKTNDGSNILEELLKERAEERAREDAKFESIFKSS